MAEMLTVHLARPIATAGPLEAPEGLGASGTASDDAEQHVRQQQLAAAIETTQRRELQKIEAQKAELAQLCKAVATIAEKLERLYQETVLGNRGEIARLAVEIARKILLHKTEQGDYDIQAIVEEALKRAPTRQEITIRVNPEDLPHCQQLQQAHPDGSLAGLTFMADWSIARADCLVETPKGVVKSFVEEHLERIGEALAKVK